MSHFSYLGADVHHLQPSHPAPPRHLHQSPQLLSPPQPHHQHMLSGAPESGFYHQPPMPFPSLNSGGGFRMAPPSHNRDEAPRRGSGSGDVVMGGNDDGMRGEAGASPTGVHGGRGGEHQVALPHSTVSPKNYGHYDSPSPTGWNSNFYTDGMPDSDSVSNTWQANFVPPGSYYDQVDSPATPDSWLPMQTPSSSSSLSLHTTQRPPQIAIKREKKGKQKSRGKRGNSEKKSKMPAVAHELSELDSTLSGIENETLVCEKMLLKARTSIKEGDTSSVHLQETAQFLRKTLARLEQVVLSDYLNSSHLREVDKLRSICFRNDFEIHLLLHEISVQGPVAELYIEQQPFPCVVTQKQKLDRSIVVRLVLGAATIVQEGNNERLPYISVPIDLDMDGILLLNHQVTPDENWVAEFDDLRILRGSGGRKISLRFYTTITASSTFRNAAPITWETNRAHSSAKFFVITNTKQWGDSAAITCSDHIFRELQSEETVNSFRFANIMQRHYLDWTRQHLHSGEIHRELSSYDFLFFFRHILHRQVTKLSSDLLLTREDFRTLWNWVGPIFHKIRYTKYLLQMWVHGLLWGFLSRNEAERQLLNSERGTFLIRFSTKTSKLCIAYTQGKKKVRHYLVDDMTVLKYGLFPDFVQNHDSLLNFLRIESKGGVVKLTRPEKSKAFKLANVRTSRVKAVVEPNRTDYDDTIFDLADEIESLQLSS
eukprot:TRINITY_DN9039_c0_g1_i1.p1 TRINITY_DN9039_c0_g1~~TRINITY_DN9039_c0_g1_i1.p1  ORF type:complete len:737 (+),score=113.61 TRINITY_DN9039_c0_g1_i1:78-2213(+)